MSCLSLFFFIDTAAPEIYTLSYTTLFRSGFDGASFAAVQQWVHDLDKFAAMPRKQQDDSIGRRRRDRKSTRLNSSHPSISYAVFCLKKKIIDCRLRDGRLTHLLPGHRATY